MMSAYSTAASTPIRSTGISVTWVHSSGVRVIVEDVVLLAQLPVLGEAPAGLAHEPHRGAVHRLQPTRPEHARLAGHGPARRSGSTSSSSRDSKRPVHASERAAGGRRTPVPVGPPRTRFDATAGPAPASSARRPCAISTPVCRGGRRRRGSRHGVDDSCSTTTAVRPTRARSGSCSASSAWRPASSTCRSRTTGRSGTSTSTRSARCRRLVDGDLASSSRTPSCATWPTARGATTCTPAPSGAGTGRRAAGRAQPGGPAGAVGVRAADVLRDEAVSTARGGRGGEGLESCDGGLGVG